MIDPVEKILDSVARGRYSARQISAMISKATIKRWLDIYSDNVIYIMTVRTPDGMKAKTQTTVSDAMDRGWNKEPQVRKFVKRNLMTSMRKFLEGQ